MDSNLFIRSGHKAAIVLYNIIYFLRGFCNTFPGFFRDFFICGPAKLLKIIQHFRKQVYYAFADLSLLIFGKRRWTKLSFIEIELVVEHDACG